jgi:hypothetical protein
VTLYGNGRAAIADDRSTADRLGWPRRRRSLLPPELLLQPRGGDPTREPWIAPPGWRPAPGASALWRRDARGRSWTYLPAVAGVDRYLNRLASPGPRGGACIGVIGLGQVGGLAAVGLASIPSARSGIAEILLHDINQPNLERWLAELASVTTWRGEPLPVVRGASPDEMLRGCDGVLFVATDAVPPIGAAVDVRMAQLTGNRSILRNLLTEGALAEFSGLLLVVSDPVEWLSLAAFVDSNADASGRFTGHGLAPERVGGLALGVMWGRGLAHARARGWEAAVRRRGAAFGPHSTEVVLFDDLVRPDEARSTALTLAAREGNLRLRELGFLPYVGPAVSSVALTLPDLLAGREVLASVFLDGIYFGAPTRLRFGMYPSRKVMAPAVREQLAALHAGLAGRAESLELAMPST